MAHWLNSFPASPPCVTLNSWSGRWQNLVCWDSQIRPLA
jgi:hypothetical protein